MEHGNDHWTIDDLLAQSQWLDRLARRLVLDANEADDVVQETWIAAMHSQRSSGSIRGWLASIARNVAIERGRSERARRARERSVARIEASEAEHAALERARAQQRLTAAVLKLDEPYRGTVLLHYFDHVPVAEIAQRHSVSESAVRTRLSRAVAELREHFRREDGAQWMSAFAPLALAHVGSLAHTGATTMGASVASSSAATSTSIGGASMAIGWKVAVGVGVVLALGWFVWTRHEDRIAGSELVRQSDAELAAQNSAVAASDASKSGAAIEATSADSQRTAAAIDATRTAPTSPAVVFTGRVLDVDKKPLANVEVSARSTDGRWDPKEQRVVPIAEASARADSAGKFQIETTVPVTTRIVVRAKTDAWWTQVESLFDPYETRAVHAGENDVGDLVVAPAGIVTGSIVCEGQPLERVHIRAPSRLTQNIASDAESRADGTFELGHLEPGSATIEIKAEGYITASRVVGEIAVNQSKDIGTIELARAPSISGHVLDSNGAPVPNALIRSHSLDDWSSGFANSQQDGAFRVFVSRPGRHSLEIANWGSTLPKWGGKNVPEATFEANTTDVRIVLDLPPNTEFHVVSAKDGSAVERFGISVGPRDELQTSGGANEVRTPPIQAHDHGVVATPARPKVHVVRVVAPGFASYEHEVAHDVSGVPVQTLRLQPESVITGRITRQGSALANVTVRIESALASGEPIAYDRLSIESGPEPELGEFNGRRRVARSDEHGAFHFDGLTAGHYRLWTRTAEGSIETREEIEVPRAATKDLGEIELELGAVVRGTLTSAPTSSVGWMLDLEGQQLKEITSADGTFEFNSVKPGTHSLRWWRKDAFGLEQVLHKEQGRSMTLELVAGETREIEIDARAQAPATVKLHVLDGDKPCAGAMLAVSWTVHGQLSTRGTSCGPTDAEGRTTFRVSGNTTARVSVLSDVQLPLGDSSDFELAPGEQRDVEIRCETTEVVLEFADDFVIPESGGFNFSLKRIPASPGGIAMSRWVTNGELLLGSQGHWTQRHMSLGRASVGDHLMRCDVFALIRKGQRTWQSSPLIPPFERTVTLRAGETAVIRIP